MERPRGGDAERRTPIARGPEQSGGKFTPAAAKTRAGDAGFPIRGRLAAIHISVFGGQKSFRPAITEAFCPVHPNSPDAGNGPVEGHNRHRRLTRWKVFHQASVKQRDITIAVAMPPAINH